MLVSQHSNKKFVDITRVTVIKVSCINLNLAWNYFKTLCLFTLITKQLAKQELDNGTTGLDLIHI